jgi:hypothetical protein
LAYSLARQPNFVANGLEAATTPSIKSVVTGSDTGVSSGSQQLAQLSLKTWLGHRLGSYNPAVFGQHVNNISFGLT